MTASLIVVVTPEEQIPVQEAFYKDHKQILLKKASLGVSMSRSDVMERVTALMVYVEGEQALPNMLVVLLLQEKYFSEGTRGCNERE